MAARSPLRSSRSSSSGRSSRREIVRTGIAHASVAAASSPPARIAASSVARTSSRTAGSIAAIAAGVKRPRTTRRNRSWSGGSAAMKFPGPVSDSVSSRFTPSALDQQRHSRAARWTSSKRLSAQNPRSSLR
jgi:hypothetical protein